MAEMMLHLAVPPFCLDATTTNNNNNDELLLADDEKTNNSRIVDRNEWTESSAEKGARSLTSLSTKKNLKDFLTSILLVK